MTRKGVPDTCDKKCSPWCAIKEKLDALWDRTHNAFTSLNGVEGDGSGNLQIEAGENIALEQSGNRIKITGEGGGVEYTARSPLDIYENEIFARMGPVEAGRTWLVHADNINTQINTAVSSEASARDAADDDLQEQIDDIMDGTAVVGHAVEADTAGTADALSGVLPQANGGTGGTSLKTINGESIVGTGNISPGVTIIPINCTSFNTFYQILSNNITINDLCDIYGNMQITYGAGKEEQIANITFIRGIQKDRTSTDPSFITYIQMESPSRIPFANCYIYNDMIEIFDIEYSSSTIIYVSDITNFVIDDTYFKNGIIKY